MGAMDLPAWLYDAYEWVDAGGELAAFAAMTPVAAAAYAADAVENYDQEQLAGTAWRGASVTVDTLLAMRDYLATRPAAEGRNPAAVALGKLGGAASARVPSDAKRAASRRNGRLGGARRKTAETTETGLKTVKGTT